MYHLTFFEQHNFMHACVQYINARGDVKVRSSWHVGSSHVLVISTLIFIISLLPHATNCSLNNYDFVKMS